MVLAHLLASPSYGGPEKQMLGLALHLSPKYRSVFLSFPERGLCRPFLEEVARHGIQGVELESNYPRLLRAVNELTDRLRALKARLLTCSGYKPDLLGWLAARRLGIPVVSVSHGWTGATWKVRLNEWLDRRVLRYMDAVVCVSEAQAVKVRRAGVKEDRIAVIRNAVAEEAFAPAVPSYRAELRGLFAEGPRWIVGAAGRLSPEKGFDCLIHAASLVDRADVGFVVFGEGPLEDSLGRHLFERNLWGRFVLAGYRRDVGKFLPHLDLVVIPSRTEGLPVILLEAFAAGVPVVATAVGGIPEVIEEGRSGRLVAPDDPVALAKALNDMLADETRLRAMGQLGRERVREEFNFAQQAEQYERLFERLLEEAPAKAREECSSSS